MKILAVGCSFMCHRGSVIPQCEILAHKFNAEIDNRSKSGNGNTHILYNTIEAVLENNYDLVVIGWSNPLRWDYVTAPHKWFALKLGDPIAEKIDKPIDIDATTFRHWSSKVLALAAFLNEKKLKFLMFNSLECYSKGNTTIHKNIEHMKNFYKVDHSQIQDLRNKSQWISTEDHHPNQDNHNFYAEELYTKYKELY